MNIKLYRKVLAHIEKHPEQWDQAVWVNECGTKACFAGWTCALSDGHSLNELPKRNSKIRARAQKLLEISYNEASWLFHSLRTKDDFYRFIGEGRRCL